MLKMCTVINLIILIAVYCYGFSFNNNKFIPFVKSKLNVIIVSRKILY